MSMKNINLNCPLNLSDQAGKYKENGFGKNAYHKW